MAQPVVGMANQKPTISGIAGNKFDSEGDAKVIRNAIKGVNTDEKAIIKILTTRNNNQVQEIRKAYAKLFDGKDLIRTIKDETSGDFEKCCVTLLLTRADFDAQCLYQAMSGTGTDENALIEIICTRTSAELEEIIKSYDRLYDKSLQGIVKSETSGDFEKFLTACLACKRPREEMKGDEAAAKHDAESLLKAGEKKMGTDEKKFIDILSTRSFTQINLIANQYEKLGKNTLITAIQSEITGTLEQAMVTVVRYAHDPAGFWADRLKDTMKGVGTEEKRLVRIMIGRAEIDLKSIRDVFGDRYGKGKTLLDWIKSDTSGDFQRLLVAILLGNEQE